MQPRFSIIIPVYNVETYLHECIESIQSQKYSDYEILLIDDGSTDSSGTMCDMLALENPHIQVVHKKNGGISSARNVGIQLATGLYYMFVDSDDTLQPDCLSEIATIIDATQCDVVMGQFTAKPERGAKNLQDYPLCAEAINNRSREDVLINLKKTGFLYVAWRYSIKSSLFKENDLAFHEGIVHEDEDWTPRLLCAASSFYVYEKPFYGYRIRNNQSIMSSITPHHLCSKLTIIERLHAYSKGYNGVEADFLRYRVFVLLLSVFSLSSTFPEYGQDLRTFAERKKRLLREYSSSSLILAVLVKLFGAIGGYTCFVKARMLKHSTVSVITNGFRKTS